MDGDVYVIKKRGFWYRPDARGYTRNLSDAGLFNEAKANCHRDAAAGVTAHRLADLLSAIDLERTCIQNDYDKRMAALENVERAALGLTYEQPQR